MMGSCSGKGCGVSMLCHWLLIIGGLNWGIFGLGWFMGKMDWNVVHMIFGMGQPTGSWLEALVYVLVGLAAIVKIFGCRCKTCTSGDMAK